MTLSLLGLFVPLVIATPYNTWNSLERNTILESNTNPITLATINGTSYQTNGYMSLSANLFSARYLFSTGFYGSTLNLDNLKNKSFVLPYRFKFEPQFNNEKAMYRINANIFNYNLPTYYNMQDMITNTLIFSDTNFLIRTDFENFAIKISSLKTYQPRDKISLYLGTDLLFYKNSSPMNYSYTYQLDLKTEVRDDGTYLVPDYVDNSQAINYPYFYTYGSTFSNLVINAFSFECGFMINNQSIYDKGFGDGYATGMTRGYQQGLDDSNEKDASYSTPLNVIKKMFDSMTSLLNIQIFPNFTIGTFVSLPLIAGAFYLILKLLKG